MNVQFGDGFLADGNGLPFSRTLAAIFKATRTVSLPGGSHTGRRGPETGPDRRGDIVTVIGIGGRVVPAGSVAGRGAARGNWTTVSPDVSADIPPLS
jgi:hypothetical protein